MYKIWICDDGENICTSIENMLKQYARKRELPIDVSIWYSGEGLKDYLEKGDYPDILFLDVEMVGMTGIEVGGYIRNQLDNMETQIVYISEKISYAQQLFKTQPLDFLVKPISQPQIDDVIDMAVRVIKKRDKRFEFRQGKDYYYVPMREIVYLGSEGRKVKVVTSKETFEYYGRLKEAAKLLSEDFITIHYSYIINREHVFRYTYEFVELLNGTILSISPANRKFVRDKILKKK